MGKKYNDNSISYIYRFQNRDMEANLYNPESNKVKILQFYTTECDSWVIISAKSVLSHQPDCFLLIYCIRILNDACTFETAGCWEHSTGSLVTTGNVMSGYDNVLRCLGQGLSRD